MGRKDNIKAVQQYMTKEITSFEDELFKILYCDLGNFAEEITPKVIDQNQRYSIYGVRGAGKTTMMQAVLMKALSQKRKEKKIVPVTVTVMGALAARNLTELNENFYKSILLGCSDTIGLKKRKKSLMNKAKDYSAWIGGKITEGLGLFVPGLELASDLVSGGIKRILKESSHNDIHSFILSKSTDVRSGVAILDNYFEEEGIQPIYVIDDLDKVKKDDILSDFFADNQSWFQRKCVIFSSKYSFGESLDNSMTSSVKRISTVKKYPGVTNMIEAQKIIQSRVMVGLSHLIKDEKKAREEADDILSKETIQAILDVSAPNTNHLLQRTYDAIQVAIETNSLEIKPEYVYTESSQIKKPTENESQILLELKKSKMTPTDIKKALDQKHLSAVSRLLRKMKEKKWVIREGSGRNAYYSLTLVGDMVIKKYSQK